MVDTERAHVSWRVLARKYRPQRFDALIGQDVLVRVMQGALRQKRVHHAWMLTGVRGTGKTTSARILARALNCTERGEEPEPCNHCADCRASLADRHVDILEMDAASNTGVDTMRELTESVKFKPAQGRYRIHIIDEVHMLSRAAFNALLKTLEEPPEHAVFIFATTESRKLPLTVISRCLRLDLRRVPLRKLADYYAEICKKEQFTAQREALMRIARAADGSVRDGLSILNQAMSQSANAELRLPQIEDMLGLADRAKLYDLYENLTSERLPHAIEQFDDLISAGASPLHIIQDLLDITWGAMRICLVGGDQSAGVTSESEKPRARALAERLAPSALARNWQIMLKGIEEMARTPMPEKTAEMVLIRLACAADLPSPEELIEHFRQNPSQAAAQTSPSPKDRSEARSETPPESPPAPNLLESAQRIFPEGKVLIFPGGKAFSNTQKNPPESQ